MFKYKPHDECERHLTEILVIVGCQKLLSKLLVKTQIRVFNNHEKCP
jgi:hypothetical protein